MHDILKKAENYVTHLFTENLGDDYTFHNLAHTQDVAATAGIIAQNSDLSRQEIEIIQLAAWFHDIGHIKIYNGHEEQSVEIARQFLQDQGYREPDIKKVTDCILATKVDQKPTTLPQKVIRDADISAIGKKGSLKRGQLLRYEWEKVLGKRYSDLEWLEFERDFYKNTKFYTDYARSQFGKRLRKNIQKIIKKLENKQRMVDTMDKTGSDNKKSEEIHPNPAEIDKKILKKAIKEKIPDRGVETVFRTTSRNHLRLSSIADTKANTLISVSALIISITMTILIDNLEFISVLPTSVILLTCVVTIVFATLSTKPKVTKNTITREDIRNKQGNLLFFGNFYEMKLEDYLWGMNEMLNDREYLYSSLTRDIYFLGLVLEKKYSYLKIAYTTFMYGIVVTVLTFLITLYT
jgi:predicted metal-dependent HD superfamily phosphohydrolase